MGKQTNKRSTQQGNQQKVATTAASNTEPANAKAAVAFTNVTATAVAATDVGAIAVTATDDDAAAAGNAVAAGNAAAADVLQTTHNAHTADDVAIAHNAATADNAVTFAIVAIPAVTPTNADAGEDANVVNCGVVTKSARTKIDNISIAHAAASFIDTTTAAGDNMESPLKRPRSIQ